MTNADSKRYEKVLVLKNDNRVEIERARKSIYTFFPRTANHQVISCHFLQPRVSRIVFYYSIAIPFTILLGFAAAILLFWICRLISTNLHVRYVTIEVLFVIV